MNLFAIVLFAGIELVAPRNGETVEQLWPNVKAFLDLPREARRQNGFNLSKDEKRQFRDHADAKPVEFKWTGDADGTYTLKVSRVPDGKVFVETVVTGCTAEVKGRLEIARAWKWSVTDGKESAEGTFRTEGRAPRIISLEGVRNARDLGGWVGLGGRRVKQGMVLRTGGLNFNAEYEYYTHDEIREMFKAGNLKGAGVGVNGKRVNASQWSDKYSRQLEKGETLDKKVRLIKAGPTQPGKERLTASDRDYLLGFWKVQSDLDLRGDWETFGMLVSPLGKDVDYYHFETLNDYGRVNTPVGRATQALNLSVFMGQESYPIDFHCIGGTDRTGTLAYLLHAFLGVDEDDCIRDYEMSFITGGGVDKQHYGWLLSLVEAVRALPGETLADKMWGYYLSLGYTAEQLTKLRERLLEPEISEIKK